MLFSPVRSLFLLTFAACSMAISNAAHAQVAPYLSMDTNTGTVYAHRNAFKRWSPASLTKLMSAYVTFRALKAGEITLKSPVRQSRNSISKPPSKMGYKVGSVMTIDTALNIILVKSANDISVALAEGVAGSAPAFIRRMNAEAARLGMTGTNFVNPHGLHSSRQYTTARDMGLLAMALHREFPAQGFRFRIPAIKSGKKVMRSHNVLIGRFRGADGMKTGFVCAAGFNLVGSATRRGKRVVSVVLGATSQNQRAELSANLLASAFNKRSGTNINRLAPYGEDRNVMANMRPKICSSAASRARWEIRDEKGRLKISSPHIQARRGELRIVPIRLGGAVGPGVSASQTTAVATLNVLPRFRPVNTVSIASATALRPTTTANNPFDGVAQPGSLQRATPTPSSNGSLVGGTTPSGNQGVLAPIPRFRPQ